MSLKEYSGKGIGVAILDTGIYPHMDFDDRIWGFFDFVKSRTAPYDDNGHGTHVAGILGGSGKASNGRHKGVAPECGILSLKILDHFGNGKKEDLMKAYDWILKYKQKYNIRIVNISIGTTYHMKNEQDLLIAGVEQLWDSGLVIVAAAGNHGPAARSITAPGCSKKIITVGSSDMLEENGSVSGRGPTMDCVCKPDVVAPGNKIISCSRNSYRSYIEKSGTSMSTPMISGAIAVMLEKDPLLSNVEIKMMLRESTDDLGLPQNIQGWGKFNFHKFLNL